MNIGAENLAYWYFRLSRLLTMTNFVVHPDGSTNQETEMNVLGVRCAHRAENLIRPIRDDNGFVRFGQKPLLLLPWWKPGYAA